MTEFKPTHTLVLTDLKNRIEANVDFEYKDETKEFFTDIIPFYVQQLFDSIEVAKDRI